MELLETTSFLLNEAERCISRFEKMREQDRSPDFFNEVKPHVNEVDSILDEWVKDSEHYIKMNRPKYLHPSQIHAAQEGMKQFVVQSFYKETSKKRFYQSVHAVLYTLKTMQSELEGTVDE
ncbi:hypothetical protein CQS04_02355 [Chryseomicrobium excrementi]|uniref:DUF1798 domain-containing protein n=1 Tax=Chryseomicrobium excrementi TaxID=2041346 RepID=A0A2M9F2Q3_9BACL|nr:YppE family protein [Chryseomicrobium excrementi]PJK17739.1 hypothetical protein CQS04_02355 [Chryseomicrobium excrementi]